MIGKLSYEQIDEVISKLLSANINLRKALEYYNHDSELSLKTSKLFQLCNDIERYTNNLKQMIELNRDVDIVIDRIKQK